MIMSARQRIRQLNAILFDKDGTLIDYNHTWAPINLQAIKLAARGNEILSANMCMRAGVDPDTGNPEPDSLFAFGNTKEIANFLVAEGSRFREQELVELLDSLFQSVATTSIPLTDLGWLFETLNRAGLFIGIASSDSHAAIQKTAASLNVHRQIDFTCGYDSGHGVKPGPGMVHAFCATIGTDVSRVAVVGDSRHDMDMARSAGTMAIGVLSGTGTRRSLAGYCDIMVESVADLPALISTSP